MPLAIDLFCGLGGWTEGLLDEGYQVIGFDIERRPYPAELVLQDVLTPHGSQFRNADLIVASPPCQKYSYMAMPWKRAKAMAAEIRQSAEKIAELNALFDACFRIQREACEAAGRYIPMVVENVCGAQPWVGRAKWHYGSFYLWGDVPALMPVSFGRKVNNHIASNSPVGVGATSWFHGNTKHQLRADAGTKNGNDWFSSGEGCSLQRRHSSRSHARKHASAMIAKIPYSLSRHIAAVYHPRNQEQTA